MPKSKLHKIGLFAMDPGTTTGLAYGILTIGSSDDMFKKNPFKVEQIDCVDERAGARVIADKFMAFTGKCNGRAERVEFVYEDFILRPGKNHNSARTGLSPVRVTALIQGMLDEHEWIEWVAQQPADAKSRWSNPRLKAAGLWTVGLEHGRDATRHAALRAVRLAAKPR